MHQAWFDVPLGVLNALGFNPIVDGFDGIVILLILAAWGWREAFGCGVAALLAPALQFPVKWMVARPRPPSTLIHVAHDIGNPAFPAGHVMDITAFLGFVCYLVHSRMGPSPRRAAVQAILVAPIALMGVARIDAGEHWPSDVLGGYLFGVVCLILAIEAYTWRRSRSSPAFHGTSVPRPRKGGLA